MDVRKTILLVGALLIAAVTAFLAKNMFAGAAAPQAAATPMLAPVPAGPKILVAMRALPIGTIIGPDSFRFQPWPSELIENAYFKEGQDLDINSLNGRVVRSAITAGQPLTQGALVKPGDRGFLAAALGPGMRAITVPVSAQSGVAGFVFPGDRVDMVLTQSLDRNGIPLRTSETIIRNLRVLATDQRTSSTNEEGKQDVQVSQTVTLEVTPRIAEKIAVAQSIGQLSLALRSITDSPADLERAIASGDVRMPANGDPKAEKRLMYEVASRPNDSNPTYVTGADVSRFQSPSLLRSSGQSASSAPSPSGEAPSAAAPTTAPPPKPAVKVWRSAIPEVAIF